MNIKKTNPRKSNKQTERDPRHRRIRAISTILTVVVIVAVILLNVIVSVLADRYPLTIDMSSDKVFTLSKDGKKFASSVTDEVEVLIMADPEDYYLSIAEYLYSNYQIDLSRQLERIGREVSTALAQLKSHSDGKITYTFINPDQEPEKFAQYTEYDLGTDENLLFIARDSGRYKKDSLANMIETVDANTINSNVEKVLISNVYALQGDGDRVIQVLTGHDEDPATIAGLKTLYELNGYIFETLNITGATEFNENAEVLLIAAPTNDYTKDEIRRIETWLNNDNKRNRHLMVFVHPTADCPNLYDLLEDNYHITVTDELIYESDDSRYFTDTTGKINPAYVWADLPSNKYTQEAVGDTGITEIIKAPQARRLLCDLPSSPTSSGIEEWGLHLTTHPESARVGTIGSEGDRKELKESEYPLVSGVSYVFEAADDNEQKAATTTVTVFGSAALAYGTYVQDNSTYNAEMLLSVIHAVTDYQTDIAISNKVIANDITYFKTDTAMKLGIWVFTVALPATILLTGLVVYVRRRRL